MKAILILSILFAAYSCKSNDSFSKRELEEATQQQRIESEKQSRKNEFEARIHLYEMEYLHRRLGWSEKRIRDYSDSIYELYYGDKFYSPK